MRAFLFQSSGKQRPNRGWGTNLFCGGCSRGDVRCRIWIEREVLPGVILLLPAGDGGREDAALGGGGGVEGVG